MHETMESVMEYGVLTPALVRPCCDEGGYEIVAGHWRKHACELAGIQTMPCIVREMDNDMATILMVDNNLQREGVLPSEKAQAYKMKLEALKRQAARSDFTSSQVGTKLRADEQIAQEAGTSRNQMQRYVRLTELSPELQQMVDEKKIGLTFAVELSLYTIRW